MAICVVAGLVSVVLFVPGCFQVAQWVYDLGRLAVVVRFIADVVGNPCTAVRRFFYDYGDLVGVVTGFFVNRHEVGGLVVFHFVMFFPDSFGRNRFAFRDAHRVFVGPRNDAVILDVRVRRHFVRVDRGAINGGHTIDAERFRFFRVEVGQDIRPHRTPVTSGRLVVVPYTRVVDLARVLVVVDESFFRAVVWVARRGVWVASDYVVLRFSHAARYHFAYRANAGQAKDRVVAVYVYPNGVLSAANVGALHARSVAGTSVIVFVVAYLVRLVRVVSRFPHAYGEGHHERCPFERLVRVVTANGAWRRGRARGCVSFLRGVRRVVDWRLSRGVSPYS